MRFFPAFANRMGVFARSCSIRLPNISPLLSNAGGIKTRITRKVLRFGIVKPFRETIVRDRVLAIHGRNVFVCAEIGPGMTQAAALSDVVAGAVSQRVEIVAIPVSRLGGDFLDLASGVAGVIVQAFFAYKLRVVVLGDIRQALMAHTPLQSFVAAANRGSQIWFCPDLTALAARLVPSPGPAGNGPNGHRVWA